ncbi:plasmid recombination protein [Qiania dongpingensis]|uniref:Plasmid recombination protein n=1 Tax=Qiania dongpingensis TaxID=2763669 RepID=A0A7G9G6N1_9FIRM|nr:plasmid recombination protein [Qiania dongpingensis]QNM06463.1 plasmid recombination protein [Qiania dongpingensis]
MSRQNYSVARVVTHTKDTIGKYERHNERKNEHYGNMNVDLSRAPFNVHFKDCGGLTYNEYLDKLVADGKVSLRGLKKDAKVYDEVIFDVNTDYFETYGGYEYAKRFYEEAYRFAVKLYGEDNILSAVLHADEINLALSDDYGKPIYHYHMHIVALPVVEKQVLWTKRCKNPELVGTVKEVIQQVSHSKKWKSPQAVDENNQPVFDKNGKPMLVPSYSILQDEFYEHMQNAGFNDFLRGERGSTAEYKSSLQYQIEKDKERLAGIEEKIAAADEKLSSVLPVQANAEIIDSMGKKTLTGKIQMSAEDYGYLSNLAKECLVNRRTVQIYESSNRVLSDKVKRLQAELTALKEKCRPYLEALKVAPQKVKDFIDGILKSLRKTVPEQEKSIFHKPPEKKAYEPSPWDLTISTRKSKPKKKEDLER